MPSDRPMPISPMPYEDFTPAMLASKFADFEGPGRAWLGLVGKTGPMADLFLPFYISLVNDENLLGYKLTELVRLAVASTTQCEACLGYLDPRSGLDADVITLFDELDRADFTPRERAAIQYTLAFCTNHHRVDDAMLDEMKSLFSDEEIMTLGLYVGVFVGMGRLAHVLRVIDSHCTLPGYRLSALVEAKAAQAAG